MNIKYSLSVLLSFLLITINGYAQNDNDTKNVKNQIVVENEELIHKGNLIIDDNYDQDLLNKIKIVKGDIIWKADNKKLFELINVKKISGSLIIENSNKLVEINMPNLEIIDNSNTVSISNNKNFYFNKINLPKLKKIDVNFVKISDNNHLKELNMDNLEMIKGKTVEINNNLLLSQIELKKLEYINGGIRIKNNSSLSSIKFNNLKSVTGQRKSFYLLGIDIISNPELTTVEFNSLVSTATLKLDDNINLNRLLLGSLKKCDQELLINNSKFKEINFPTLENKIKKLEISHNKFLNSIDLHMIDSINSLKVYDNKNLKKLNLENLQATNNLTIGNNGLQSLKLDNLSSVAYDLNLNSDKISVIEFPRLLKVGKNLRVINMRDLKELKIPNILYIGKFNIIKSFVKNPKSLVLESLITIKDGMIVQSTGLKEIILESLYGELYIRSDKNEELELFNFGEIVGVKTHSYINFTKSGKVINKTKFDFANMINGKLIIK